MKTKSMISKLGAMALSVAMVGAMTIIPSFAASEVTDTWDGTADTSWYTGSSPYTLDSAEDLAGLASLVNSGTDFSGKVVNLTVNVQLNTTAATSASATGQQEWTPIGGGAYANSFKGTFDGQNNTISNIFYNHSDGTYSKGDSVKNNIGLFGKLEEGATVKNITVSGGYVGAQRSVGAIVGKSWGTMDNCHNAGVYVYGTDSKGLGGVVGANWINTATNLPVIKNCSNTGTVYSAYSKGAAGGIAGENEGYIINSYNTGAVTCSAYNAGGIAGYSKGSIQNCYNSGNITATYAGQIAGFAEGTYVNDNLYCKAGLGDATSSTSTATLSSSTYSAFSISALVSNLNNWVNNHSGNGYLTWSLVNGTAVL